MLLLGPCQSERPVLSRAMVTSGVKLLLMAMSGSMVLLHLGFVLMSTASVKHRGP